MLTYVYLQIAKGTGLFAFVETVITFLIFASLEYTVLAEIPNVMPIFSLEIFVCFLHT